MPCRSASVSQAKATSKRSFNSTIRAMAQGDDGSMRIWPSQSTLMKRNVASTVWLTTSRFKPQRSAIRSQ